MPCTVPETPKMMIGVRQTIGEKLEGRSDERTKRIMGESKEVVGETVYKHNADSIWK